MVTTHELGHIACGLMTGGQLIDYRIAPWHLPHSTFDPDPYPLVTLWGGPLLGCVVPLALAAVMRRTAAAWFAADFCLLANGTYLALAWITGDSHLDTARILRAGTPPWVLAAYCAVTITTGYGRFRRDCVEVLSLRSGETPAETTAEHP